MLPQNTSVKKLKHVSDHIMITDEDLLVAFMGKKRKEGVDDKVMSIEKKF